MNDMEKIERYFKYFYPQFCDKKDGTPIQDQFDIFCKGVETSIMILEHFRDEVEYKKYKEND